MFMLVIVIILVISYLTKTAVMISFVLGAPKLDTYLSADCFSFGPPVSASSLPRYAESFQTGPGQKGSSQKCHDLA